MGYLALDLSKTATGWAAWKPGWEKPVCGTWKLGSPYTTRGQMNGKLHRNMMDVHQTVCRLTHIFVEEPINVHKSSNTSLGNIRISIGLAEHAESFAAAIGAKDRYFEYNVESWRPDFVGRDESVLIKRAAKRAQRSATDPLKAATVARCKILGLSPKNDNEGDALGVLTYGLLQCGITPSWLADEVLRPALGLEPAA